MVYAFNPPSQDRQGRAELEAAQTRQRMLAAQADPEVGQRVIRLHQTWPDIPPGALMAMAMAGIDPDTDIAESIEKRAVEKQADLGFFTPGETVNAAQVERETQARELAEQENPLFRGVKAASRGLFFGLGSAFDEVSRRATAGLVAAQDPDLDYGQAMELSTPSMGALVAGDEFEFEDLGSGWLPGGKVAAEQERLKQRLTVDGEWMSPGRALAINVVEPGTKPFNLMSGMLDFAFNIVGDPSSYALAGAGKLRNASKAFATDSALIRGIRRMPDEQYAAQWWHGSTAGQRLRANLTEDVDAYSVWRKLGGEQGKVDVETARQIAAARTAEELDGVVLPRLGPQGIAEKPTGGMLSRTLGVPLGDDAATFGLGYSVRRASDNFRFTQWMPDQTIDITNPDRAAVTIHRFLRGIKASDEETSKLMNRALNMGATDEPDNWLEFAKELTQTAADRAYRDSVRAGVEVTDEAGNVVRMAQTAKAERRAQHIRENIGRAFERKQAELTNYFTKEAGKPRSGVTTLLDGTEVDLSQVPNLVTQYLHRNIPLPDMQDVRRHIGTYARVMRATNDLPRPLVEGVTDLATGFMTTLWKPMVLLRGAYIARVVGEEQLRMAASGLDSLFRHPFSYVAYLSGRKGGVGIADDIVKDMAEFQSIAQRKGGGWLGKKPGQVGTGDWITYKRFDTAGNPIDDRAFARAWSDSFSMLVNDPITQLVAREGTEAAKDYLLSAKGKHMRRTLASSETWRDVATSPEALGRYVDDVVWGQIDSLTRGNTDLINAIGTGRLDGQIIRWTGPTGGDGPSALQKGLAARMDDVNLTEVGGRRFITTSRRGSTDHNLLDRYNQAVDMAADVIMSKPTNAMSRYPVWQQTYVRNIEAQLGFMDAPTQRAAIKWAKDNANLSRAEVRRMEATAKAGVGTKITSVEDADMIARSQATFDTRKLLYELTEQGQFEDAARAAMPFAGAWLEVAKTWPRIMAENPQSLRRGQQAVEGARGAGFFYQDPSTGEERFVYPGGKFVTRAMLAGYADSGLMQTALSLPGVGALATAGLGVAGAFLDEQPAEADLTGSVEGLNLMTGSVMPGFGPAVTIPASQLLPERPEFDWVRDNVLFPFGEPDVEAGVFEALMPAWADKLRTAWMKDPDTDRIYANSVFDVAKALLATGDYSTQTPEENERLLTASKERAKSLWLIRGAAQFVAPTGPAVTFRAKDLEGDWWPFQLAASEFARMQQEHGQEAAVDEFLSTFGTDMVTLIQSKSREIVPRPTSEVGDDWIQANPDLVRDFPLTVGLIAPDDPDGRSDYTAYLRQFDEGSREQLMPQQMLWLSNNTLGRLAYAHAVEQIDTFAGNETEARAARAAARSQLMERFPGFNSHVGVSERPRVEDQIAELERMASDPRIENEPAVAALADYLEARRQALAMVPVLAKRSTTFKTSEETRPIREFLRRRADEIGQVTPEFITLWDRVFSRELADDEVVEPGQIGNA